jgi:hypothetical protein
MVARIGDGVNCLGMGRERRAAVALAGWPPSSSRFAWRETAERLLSRSRAATF